MVSMLHRDAGLAMVHVPKTGGTALGAALMRARDGWEEAADLPGLKAGMAAHDLALRRRVYTPRHARALDMRGALGGAAWRGWRNTSF
ncbi:MAG: hypothetical protein HWD84_08390 [Flavobacteriaceae bacterium]|nr:hypothetical protein [Flavobacteriaceae bacterium]